MEFQRYQAFEQALHLWAEATGAMVMNRLSAMASNGSKPYLVDCPGQLQRHTLARGTLGLLALAHGQVRRAVQPVDPLVVHTGELGPQQVVDAPVAEAPSHMRDLDDLAGELLHCCVHLRWVAVAVAGEPHKTTRATLGQMLLAEQPVDRPVLGLWG
jgi:hypothetical protein